MTEWNTYAIEDLISAFTLTPLIPYWYAAQGKCEGEEKHWNCPKDWDEEKHQIRKEWDGEGSDNDSEESEPEDDDFKAWEESDEPRTDSDDEPETDDEDGEIDVPETEDPLNLNITL